MSLRASVVGGETAASIGCEAPLRKHSSMPHYLKVREALCSQHCTEYYLLGKVLMSERMGALYYS